MHWLQDDRDCWVAVLRGSIDTSPAAKSPVAYEDVDISSPPLFVPKGKKVYHPPRTPPQTEKGRLRLYTESDAKLPEQTSMRVLKRGAISYHKPANSEYEQSQGIRIEPNRAYNFMQGKPATQNKTKIAKKPIQRRQSSKELISKDAEKISHKEIPRRFSIPEDYYDDVVAPRKVTFVQNDDYYEIVNNDRYQNLDKLHTEAPPLPYRNRSKVILEKPPAQLVPDMTSISSRPRSALLQTSHDQLSTESRRIEKARSASPIERSHKGKHVYNYIYIYSYNRSSYKLQILLLY